jgi:hypothetical protein
VTEETSLEDAIMGDLAERERRNALSGTERRREDREKARAERQRHQALDFLNGIDLEWLVAFNEELDRSCRVAVKDAKARLRAEFARAIKEEAVALFGARSKIFFDWVYDNKEADDMHSILSKNLRHRALVDLARGIRKEVV